MSERYCIGEHRVVMPSGMVWWLLEYSDGTYETVAGRRVRK